MQYLVAIHHPDDHDPLATEDDAMHRDIDMLNDEMVAAGIRVFVGGLHLARDAWSLRPQPGGDVSVGEGPYLQTSEHMAGFWVLDVAGPEEAVEWGRKAVAACRAPVEVRPFR